MPDDNEQHELHYEPSPEPNKYRIVYDGKVIGTVTIDLEATPDIEPACEPFVITNKSGEITSIEVTAGGARYITEPGSDCEPIVITNSGPPGYPHGYKGPMWWEPDKM